MVVCVGRVRQEGQRRRQVQLNGHGNAEFALTMQRCIDVQPFEGCADMTGLPEAAVEVRTTAWDTPRCHVRVTMFVRPV